MRVSIVVAALAGCVLAVSAGPAFSDSEGAVSAQVTVAAPCIQVTPAQLDFGVLGFSPNTASPVVASRALTATNCSAGSASLLARGTNASSSGGTTWTLEPNQPDMCSTANRFTQWVEAGPTSFPLSTQNTPITSLGGGQASGLNALLVMPCSGSSGAGEVMTFSYIFTALLQ